MFVLPRAERIVLRVQYPQVYQRVQTGYLFTYYTLIVWLALAVWHSIGAPPRPVRSGFVRSSLLTEAEGDSVFLWRMAAAGK
jgi:hypothetical protein